MSQFKFISADAIGKSLAASKLYLMKRPADYARFIKDLNLAEGDDGLPVVELDNGKVIHFYPDDRVALVDDDCTTGKLFPTWEQLAAYYLAKHW